MRVHAARLEQDGAQKIKDVAPAPEKKGECAQAEREGNGVGTNTPQQVDALLVQDRNLGQQFQAQHKRVQSGPTTVLGGAQERSRRTDPEPTRPTPQPSLRTKCVSMLGDNWQKTRTTT